MIDILIDEDPDSADYLLGPVNDFTDRLVSFSFLVLYIFIAVNFFK